MAKVIVTGGAGFIGSALIRHLILHTSHEVLNIDKLTYAGSLLSLAGVESHPRYKFLKADIRDRHDLESAFREWHPDLVFHLAAESHVDRSIEGPEIFIQTNVVGTFRLLETCRDYLASMDATKRDDFRFVHVSTDEVFGSLGETGFFSESTAYQPRSPYSASKAASDHLVRSWHHTYGLPILITNCSNNYGPYQFPEKFIPVVILNALNEQPIPIYGEGKNTRDWLHVEDHVSSLLHVATESPLGHTYLVSGRNEVTNISLVQMICSILDKFRPRGNGHPYSDLIKFVQDRPGHDLRYAVDPSKIESLLGWKAKIPLDEGLRTTVNWYLDNFEWCQAVSKNQHQIRLGLLKASA